jgi:hypothetical protein
MYLLAIENMPIDKIEINKDKDYNAAVLDMNSLGFLYIIQSKKMI